MNDKAVPQISNREKQFFWNGVLLGILIGIIVITFLLAYFRTLNS